MLHYLTFKFLVIYPRRTVHFLNDRLLIITGTGSKGSRGTRLDPLKTGLKASGEKSISQAVIARLSQIIVL